MRVAVRRQDERSTVEDGAGGSDSGDGHVRCSATVCDFEFAAVPVRSKGSRILKDFPIDDGRAANELSVVPGQKKLELVVFRSPGEKDPVGRECRHLRRTLRKKCAPHRTRIANGADGWLGVG